MTAPLNASALEFVTARHLATLTTLLADGFPHVVPVGFTFEPASESGAGTTGDGPIGTVRIITNGPSQKVLNVRRDGRARILEAPDDVADAVARYAVRYRQPRENPTRVVIAIEVDRVMKSSLLDDQA